MQAFSFNTSQEEAEAHFQREREAAEEAPASPVSGLSLAGIRPEGTTQGTGPETFPSAPQAQVEAAQGSAGSAAPRATTVVKVSFTPPASPRDADGSMEVPAFHPAVAGTMAGEGEVQSQGDIEEKVEDLHEDKPPEKVVPPVRSVGQKRSRHSASVETKIRDLARLIFRAADVIGGADGVSRP